MSRPLPQFQGGNNSGWGTTYDADGDTVATFNGKVVMQHTADGDPATYSQDGRYLSYPRHSDGEPAGIPIQVNGKTVINIVPQGDVKPWM
jgi:hypothetical protein